MFLLSPLPDETKADALKRQASLIEEELERLKVLFDGS